MAYIEETLGKDEKVIYQCNASKWWAILPSIPFGLGVSCLFAYVFGDKYKGEDITFFIGVFFSGVVGGQFSEFFLATLNQSIELGITDRRVVAKHGIVKRHAIELNIAKIETVAVNQGFFGRIFDYGSLVISGTGNPNAPIKGIDKPMEFRRKLMEYLDSRQGKSKA